MVSSQLFLLPVVGSLSQQLSPTQLLTLPQWDGVRIGRAKARKLVD